MERGGVAASFSLRRLKPVATGNAIGDTGEK